MSPRPLGRAFILAIAALALGLWGAFLCTLSPAYPPDDSPETITAAALLGVQHPPGYPLAAQLGRLADAGLALGSPAWRVNLLSALLATLCCVACAVLVRRALDGRRFAGASGLAAGAWLGLSGHFWRCATEAKGGIYLLNALLLELVFLAALEAFTAEQRGDGRGSARALRFAALAAGLALANHYPSALVCLPALALPWLAGPRSGLNGRNAAGWALLLAAGLALYAYLPLRAALDPPLNTGDARTWARFWWTVLREGYSHDPLQFQPSALALRAADWWSFLWAEGGPLLPPIAAWGLWAACRPDSAPRRRLALGLLAVWAAVLAAVVGLNRTPAEILQVQDNFLLPQDLAACALAGLGIALAAERLLGRSGRGGTLLASCLPLALGATLFGSGAEAQDRSEDFAYYDFGRGVLLSLPPGAVYLPEGDFYFMPLYYSQWVEGRRPDVACVHRNRFYGLDGFADLKRLRPDWSVRLIGGLSTLQCLLRDNAPRYPFCVGTYHESLRAQDLDGGFLVQRGLVDAVQSPPVAWPSPDLGFALPLRFQSWGPDMRDPDVRRLLRWYRESWAEQQRELDLRARHEPSRTEAAALQARSARYAVLVRCLKDPDGRRP